MKKFIATVAVALLGVAASAQAEVAVIVNQNASASPNQAQVANIFLGKDKSLTGIDQSGWGPVKDKFYTSVTSKNESQLKSYWSSLIFTGKGQPLASVDGDAAVVARVSADPNVIGYVSSSAVTDGVRVLFTIP
ncbi:phosphate ABC transporter substrate-binding protein [Pseudomonas sp.]|uniref:phosphate ABC transporter substrate-binding protein n=1 Tax=Pseudomonas sp. TaxID=306 RepID=UPI00272C8CB2|nr:phosphate ABC transporter substrate-binding protein [Pseudomonas sp.]